VGVALAQLAVDVLDHDDGAVDDDSEVDGADGKKVRCFSREMKKDKCEKQRKRNGKSGDDRGPYADQKENEHDQNQNHSAQEIAFDGVGGDADKIAAVVVGTDAHVARQHGPVDFFGLSLDAFQNVLRLLAAAHQNDAFYGVIVVFGLVLEAEDAQARRVADFDVADVLDAHRGPVVAGHDDLADIVG